MNHDHLHTFIIVAEQRSFSEAAKILYLSQPTITSHIKSLEQSINAPLFFRSKKFVETTPAADVLYPYAKEILNLNVKAQNKIDNLMKDIHGKITVAASLTIGESIMPKLLYNFKIKYPNVDIFTEITNSQQIVESIKKRVLDFGLIEADLHEPGLVKTPFMMDELQLVTKKNFFQSKKSSVTIEDLKDIPMVLREQGSGTRSVLDHYLYKHGMSPEDLNIVLDLASTESVKTAVEAGLGASILSKHAIRKEIQLGMFSVIPIEYMTLKRNFYIVHSKGVELPLIIEKFIEMVHSSTYYNFSS